MSEEKAAIPKIKAIATIDAGQQAGAPISRFLFGKFTEHLGRNVYGGAWAEAIENPWFAPIDNWPNTDVIKQRLQNLASEHNLPDISNALDQGFAPFLSNLRSGDA